jgi:hypothetical protein
MNPVRGGLPIGPDEMAAFKLVAAAMLMAYVEVRPAASQLSKSTHCLASCSMVQHNRLISACCMAAYSHFNQSRLHL